MQEGKQKLFSKIFWQLFIINLSTTLNFYSLMVSIGPFAIKTYQVSLAMAGLVAGITVIGTLVARSFAGYLTTKFKPRQLMIIGMALMVPVLLAYLLPWGVGFLLFVRFWQGIAMGLVGTVTNTIVVYVVPESRRSEGISYFSLSTIVATAIGPFFALLLMQYFSFNLVFWIEAVIAIGGLAVAISVNSHDVPSGPNEEREENIQSLSDTSFVNKFLEPKVFSLSFIMFFVTLAYASLQSDLDLFAEKLHISSYASYFFLIYAIVILLSRPITGRIMDTKNENYVVYPCLILLAIGMVIIGSLSSGIVLLFSAVFVGIGYGNFQSTMQSIVAKQVSSDRLGQANSTYFICFDLGLGVGPYLLGALISIIGYRALFISMGIISIVGMGFYLLAHGRKIYLHEGKQ